VSPDSIDIRKCHQLDEMRACVRLQQEVWNFSDADLVPLRMFVVAEKIGGQVIAAFMGNEIVGFALSIPGVRGGQSYLHSHMLAVRKQYQNAGLGRRIKLFQRDDALARGFELIEWTFDPLEIKNAYLNIEKLGAIARRYSVQPVRHYVFTVAGRTAHRPVGGRMVAEVETGRNLAANRKESAHRNPGHDFRSGSDLRLESLSHNSMSGKRRARLQSRTIYKSICRRIGSARL
jgi:predicted GNAT superfamily acetyltransferase